MGKRGSLGFISRLTRMSLRFRVFLFFLMLGAAIPLVMTAMIYFRRHRDRAGRA